MLQDQFLFLPKVVGLCQDSNTRTGVHTLHTCVHFISLLLTHRYIFHKYTFHLSWALSSWQLPPSWRTSWLCCWGTTPVSPMYCYWCKCSWVCVCTVTDTAVHSSGAGTMVITLWAPPVPLTAPLSHCNNIVIVTTLISSHLPTSFSIPRLYKKKYL